MKKSVYNELLAKVEALEKLVNGGKGSGNFGHAGRPGEVGGSGSGIGGSSKASKDTSSDEMDTKLGENVKKLEERKAEIEETYKDDFSAFEETVARLHAKSDFARASAQMVKKELRKQGKDAKELQKTYRELEKRKEKEKGFSVPESQREDYLLGGILYRTAHPRKTVRWSSKAGRNLTYEDQTGAEVMIKRYLEHKGKYPQ